MEERGRQVGPYVLGPEIARGGVGVVYEAVDEKLRRKVALKVILGDFPDESNQRARFRREARLLASVRHPNVAMVYGVVEEGDEIWLALEFLEGENLADVLRRGALSMEEALDVARQIAAGLEAAHECGVVHRDLKPANVQRQPDGKVKVLDFGLAMPVEAEGDVSGVSTAGVILGTPLYMSPEQIRGRPLDRRTDIWSFGCTLWELLTGSRPFEAQAIAEVVGAILEREPDYDRLPANTPPRVREMLERCFSKDPEQRLRDVGDARLELQTALAERAWSKRKSETNTQGGAKRASGWLSIAAFAVAACLIGMWLGGRRATSQASPERVLRLALDLPAGEKRVHPRLSPDGRTLVHEIAPRRGPEGRYLVARPLDSFEDVPIPGTERVDTFCFSRDGKRLAVVRVAQGQATRYELVLVNLDGSEPPTFITALPDDLSSSGSAAWTKDGRVALAALPGILLLVHTDGSGRIDRIPIVRDENEWPHAPDVFDELPTGHVLASAFHQGATGAHDSIVAIDPETGVQTVLVENSSYVLWSLPGHLLYTRAEVLFRAPLDLETLTVGEPVVIARDLRQYLNWKSAQFHGSREGSLIWWPADFSTQHQLSLVDGSSEPGLWSEQAVALEGFMTLDATKSFFTAVIAGPAGNYELWGSEVEQPNLRRLLSSQGQDYWGGVPLLDGGDLIVSRSGSSTSEIRRTKLGQPDEGVLLYRTTGHGVSLRSPKVTDDGSRLYVSEVQGEKRCLLAFDLEKDPPLEAKTIFEAPRSLYRMHVSPSGRWLLTAETAQAPFIRSIAEDGSLGSPIPVPSGGLDWMSTAWGVGDQGSDALLTWVTESFDVYRTEISNEGAEVRFSNPERLTYLKGKRFWDALHLGGSRFLGVLIDRQGLAFDRLHLQIGGMPVD